MVIRSNLKASPRRLDIPDALMRRLSAMQIKAKNISDSSLESIQKSESQYYARMSRVVRRPWIYSRDYKSVNPAQRYQEKLTQTRENKMSWYFEILYYIIHFYNLFFYYFNFTCFQISICVCSDNFRTSILSLLIINLLRIRRQNKESGRMITCILLLCIY